MIILWEFSDGIAKFVFHSETVKNNLRTYYEDTNPFAFATTALIAASNANAADIDVKITNLTQGIYFTPLLVTAHSSDAMLYKLGEAAPPELQAMAEGGSLDGLVAIVDSIGADTMANPAGGLLAPASSTMTNIMTSDGNT